ncbi:MAG: hypothetical protein DHS20C16_14680 [Phycisphaerae bacterium]|nr:MAG: hypothetical protein DHS20C16_14680 [Phycisphaerae bacterium]
MTIEINVSYQGPHVSRNSSPLSNPTSAATEQSGELELEEAGIRFLNRLSPVFRLDDEEAIRAFLRAPGFNDDPRDFLDHPSAQVVQTASMCLGLTGNMQDADRLVDLLHHDDYFVVSAVEKSIWSIWMQASNPACVTWLHQAIDCMQAGYYDESETLLDLILIEDPEFAEACNQRAILHHLTGRYESSMMACHRTLALNANHYGAAAGLGHNYFHLGDFEKARDAFRKALGIHARMEGIRQAIRRCNLAAVEPNPHAHR